MYISTRSNHERVSAGRAIIEGLANDGGLFVSERMPEIELATITQLVNMNYQQRAKIILEKFLTDYSDEQLNESINQAYGHGFDCAEIAPVKQLDKHSYILELWHGPTSAFKDMALQLLPQLLSYALKNNQENAEIVILVATSGDTGKAALEGFRDVDQTKIITFFPHNGVSAVQRLQMITQEGKNVAVIGVNGNFDDAQSGVKNIFGNADLARELAGYGYRLSSANSINWGRLVPQIVYYFSAYADWIKQSGATVGQKVNFVVPTGNFGNILAGYYAKCMGLPINKLICASNDNNVLSEFLASGKYDRNRAFYKTISPSMDILISSNLERLLYSITNGNTDKVRNWMEELRSNGAYTIGSEELQRIQDVFWGDWADEAETLSTIKNVYEKFGYVLDPHTAVAYNVNEKYVNATQDDTPVIMLSTASPFKFSNSVLEAITGPKVQVSEMEALGELSRITRWTIPVGLQALSQKECIHQLVCEKQAMKDVVKNILRIPN